MGQCTEMTPVQNSGFNVNEDEGEKKKRIHMVGKKKTGSMGQNGQLAKKSHQLCGA